MTATASANAAAAVAGGRSVRAGQRCDRGAHQQRRSALRPHRQDPAAAEERVHHQGRQRRPEPGDRFEPGEPRRTRGTGAPDRPQPRRRLRHHGVQSLANHAMLPGPAPAGVVGGTGGCWARHHDGSHRDGRRGGRNTSHLVTDARGSGGHAETPLLWHLRAGRFRSGSSHRGTSRRSRARTPRREHERHARRPRGELRSRPAHHTCT